MTTKPWTRLAGVSLLTLLAAGCGLKGRLYLPPAADAAAVSDSTPDTADEAAHKRSNPADGG